MDCLEQIGIRPLRPLRAGVDYRFIATVPAEHGGKLAGETVEIELVIPPLNLSGLQLFDKKFREAKTDLVGQMRELLETLDYCLARNYTGVPRWLLEQAIDLGNFQELLQIVMDVSGVKRKEHEEKKAKAATSTSGSTGTN
jgi:hypothetical protein